MLEGQHNFFFGYADGQEFFRHPFFNQIDLHPNLAIMEANLGACRRGERIERGLGGLGGSGLILPKKIRKNQPNQLDPRSIGFLSDSLLERRLPNAPRYPSTPTYTAAALMAWVSAQHDAAA